MHPTSSRPLAQSTRHHRDAFLGANGRAVPSQDPIRISWGRSHAALVDVDRVSPPFTGPADRPTVLTRAAAPIFAALAAELANEPISLVLTDANGLVLMRGGGDGSLLTRLDAVSLAPGFTYSEEAVGTNGIGTALEVGAAILIDGPQHYSGELCAFSCAGAPVTHPVTGSVLGVFDVTAHAEHSNSLLLSYAKRAASRISEQILDDSSALDQALLRDYRRACHHSGGPVIALGGETVIINALMQRHFDAADQTAIMEQTQDARGRTLPFNLLAELPSGAVARLSYQPTFHDDRLAGGVVQVRQQQARSTATSHPRTAALAGVAGSSAQWLHTTHQVLEACLRSDWVILEGEPGVGKKQLLQAAHARSDHGRSLVVVDVVAGDPETEVVDVATAVLDSGSDLLLHHAHVLTVDQLDRLAVALQEHHDSGSPDGPWVALTVLEGVPTDHWGTHLLGFFPRTVRVPPLRHHLTDLPALVRLVLDQAGATELSLSAPALNQLMRLSWTGNVAHLRWVLGEVSRRRRSGEVGLGDLPPECHSTTRRQLTLMEAMERDAVVEALSLHDGDKAAASASLGMSRATIYRKIRHYGIQV